MGARCSSGVRSSAAPAGAIAGSGASDLAIEKSDGRAVARALARPSRAPSILAIDDIIFNFFRSNIGNPPFDTNSTGVGVSCHIDTNGQLQIPSSWVWCAACFGANTPAAYSGERYADWIGRLRRFCQCAVPDGG